MFYDRDKIIKEYYKLSSDYDKLMKIEKIINDYYHCNPQEDFVVYVASYIITNWHWLEKLLIKHPRL